MKTMLFRFLAFNNLFCRSIIIQIYKITNL